MPLKAEDGEAYELATRLAGLTGESLPEAVTKALLQRLRAEQASREVVTNEEVASRLAAARHIRELGRRFRDEGETSDHDWLYDENGLPW